MDFNTTIKTNAPTKGGLEISFDLPSDLTTTENCYNGHESISHVNFSNSAVPALRDCASDDTVVDSPVPVEGHVYTIVSESTSVAAVAAEDTGEGSIKEISSDRAELGTGTAAIFHSVSIPDAGSESMLVIDEPVLEDTPLETGIATDCKILPSPGSQETLSAGGIHSNQMCSDGLSQKTSVSSEETAVESTVQASVDTSFECTPFSAGFDSNDEPVSLIANVESPARVKNKGAKASGADNNSKKRGKTSKSKLTLAQRSYQDADERERFVQLCRPIDINLTKLSDDVFEKYHVFVESKPHKKGNSSAKLPTGGSQMSRKRTNSGSTNTSNKSKKSNSSDIRQKSRKEKSTNKRSSNKSSQKLKKKSGAIDESLRSIAGSIASKSTSDDSSSSSSESSDDEDGKNNWRKPFLWLHEKPKSVLLNPKMPKMNEEEVPVKKSKIVSPVSKSVTHVPDAPVLRIENPEVKASTASAIEKSTTNPASTPRASTILDSDSNGRVEQRDSDEESNNKPKSAARSVGKELDSISLIVPVESELKSEFLNDHPVIEPNSSKSKVGSNKDKKKNKKSSESVLKVKIKIKRDPLKPSKISHFTTNDDSDIAFSEESKLAIVKNEMNDSDKHVLSGSEHLSSDQTDFSDCVIKTQLIEKLPGDACAKSSTAILEKDSIKTTPASTKTFKDSDFFLKNLSDIASEKRTKLKKEKHKGANELVSAQIKSQKDLSKKPLAGSGSDKISRRPSTSAAALPAPHYLTPTLIAPSARREAKYVLRTMVDFVCLMQHKSAPSTFATSVMKFTALEQISVETSVKSLFSSPALTSFLYGSFCRHLDVALPKLSRDQISSHSRPASVAEQPSGSRPPVHSSVLSSKDNGASSSMNILPKIFNASANASSLVDTKKKKSEKRGYTITSPEMPRKSDSSSKKSRTSGTVDVRGSSKDSSADQKQSSFMRNILNSNAVSNSLMNNLKFKKKSQSDRPISHSVSVVPQSVKSSNNSYYNYYKQQTNPNVDPDQDDFRSPIPGRENLKNQYKDPIFPKTVKFWNKDGNNKRDFGRQDRTAEPVEPNSSPGLPDHGDDDYDEDTEAGGGAGQSTPPEKLISGENENQSGRTTPAKVSQILDAVKSLYNQKHNNPAHREGALVAPTAPAEDFLDTYLPKSFGSSRNHKDRKMGVRESGKSDARASGDATGNFPNAISNSNAPVYKRSPWVSVESTRLKRPSSRSSSNDRRPSSRSGSRGRHNPWTNGGPPGAATGASEYKLDRSLAAQSASFPPDPDAYEGPKHYDNLYRPAHGMPETSSIGDGGSTYRPPKTKYSFSGPVVQRQSSFNDNPPAFGSSGHNDNTSDLMDMDDNDDDSSGGGEDAQSANTRNRGVGALLAGLGQSKPSDSTSTLNIKSRGVGTMLAAFTAPDDPEPAMGGFNNRHHRGVGSMLSACKPLTNIPSLMGQESAIPVLIRGRDYMEHGTDPSSSASGLDNESLGNLQSAQLTGQHFAGNSMIGMTSYPPLAPPPFMANQFYNPAVFQPNVSASNFGNMPMNNFAIAGQPSVVPATSSFDPNRGRPCQSHVFSDGAPSNQQKQQVVADLLRAIEAQSPVPQGFASNTFWDDDSSPPPPPPPACFKPGYAGSDMTNAPVSTASAGAGEELQNSVDGVMPGFEALVSEVFGPNASELFPLNDPEFLQTFAECLEQKHRPTQQQPGASSSEISSDVISALASFSRGGVDSGGFNQPGSSCSTVNNDPPFSMCSDEVTTARSPPIESLFFQPGRQRPLLTTPCDQPNRVAPLDISQIRLVFADLLGDPNSILHKNTAKRDKVVSLLPVLNELEGVSLTSGDSAYHKSIMTPIVEFATDLLLESTMHL